MGQDRHHHVELEVPVGAAPGDGGIVADDLGANLHEGLAHDGVDLAGMIDDPGCVAGSWISPMPQRGPLLSQRMSLVSLKKLTAIVFNRLLAWTRPSFAPWASKWSAASRKEISVSMAIMEMARRANSGWH